MSDHVSSEEKKAKIRRGAYRCFRDRGYYETTVDEICKEAGGIAKGSFYWHYQSKLEVFLDILESWTREVMNELFDQFEAAASKEDYARAIAGALEREIKRGRVIVPLWLEFSSYARRDAEVRAAVAKFYRRARQAVAQILRPLFSNVAAEAEMSAVAQAVFGAYVGILIQDAADPEGGDATQSVAQVMSVIGRLATRYGADPG